MAVCFLLTALKSVKDNQFIKTEQSMKKVLFVCLMALGAFTVTAQNKIGYISTEDLISEMPEAVKADAELKEYQQSLAQQYQDMMKELNDKDSIFVKDSMKLSASMKEIKRDELVSLYQRIQNWNNQAQDLYQQKAQEKVAPLRTKAMDAIKAVAKESGYGYVLDASAIIVAPPGDDLLPLVRKKLGITPPAAPKP
jgi:outer membrane protein